MDRMVAPIRSDQNMLRNIEYFYTAVDPDPHTDPTQPIQVMWSLGGGGRNRGIINVYIPPRITQEASLRPLLAEIAAIYYVFVEAGIALPNRDGRNLTFVCTHATQIKDFVLKGGTDIHHDLETPTRLLALRFNDAHVIPGSEEFFDNLINVKGKEISRIDEYDFSRPPLPIMKVSPLGDAYITYTALHKYAYRIGSFIRGSWSDLLRISGDRKNRIVCRLEFTSKEYGEIEVIDIFSPQTCTLLHCIEDTRRNFKLIDVQNISPELRETKKISIKRDYGEYVIDLSVFPPVKQRQTKDS